MGKEGYIILSRTDDSQFDRERLKKMGFKFTDQTGDNYSMYRQNANFFKNKGTMTEIRYPKSDTADMAFDHTRYFNTTFKLSKDDILLNRYGFSMIKNHKLFKIFKTWTQKLIENGMILEHDPTTQIFKKIININHPDSEWKVHDKAKELTRLSLTDLSAGFVIWIISVFAAILVFFGELVSYRIRKMLKSSRTVNSSRNMRKMKRKHMKLVMRLKSKKLRKKHIKNLQKRRIKKIIKNKVHPISSHDDINLISSNFSIDRILSTSKL